MRWRRAVLVLIGAPVAAVVAGWPLYVQPPVDTVSAADPADAVLALGEPVRTAGFAHQLLRDGAARHLVVSNPFPPTEPGMSELCPSVPRVDVTCFKPEPGTTRGEARALQRLAEQNGWDDVVVVAPAFHIVRARMIIKRCYPGRLRMVELDASVPARLWPYQYLYQTAAFGKAAVLSSC